MRASSNTLRHEPPPDVGDGGDDDAFAAQLRKLATSEPDEKLREAYWKEYREYKKSIR